MAPVAVFLILLTTAVQRGVESLTPSSALVRALKGGETHAYEMALERGQFLYVVVDQLGIDVGVTVANSERILASSDNPNGAFGPEPLAVIADQAGDYRIEVRPLSATAAPASYEIRVAALRPATAEDREHVAALQAFAEGQRLRAQNTAESRRQAIAQYEKALAFFRSSGDRFNQVLTAYRIAYVYANSSDFRKAVELLNEILPLTSSLNDSNMVASVLNLLGGSYDVLGDFDKSLKHYSEALVQFRAIGSRESASVLNNIGKIYAETAEWQKALDYYTQALQMFQAAGDNARQAIALLNIGLIHSRRLGDVERGLDFFQRALSLAQAAGDKGGEALTLENIAEAQIRLGQSARALEHYEQALSLRKTVGDPRGLAYTLSGLGDAYATIGDLSKAAENYETALPFFRRVTDRRDGGHVLVKLADVRTRQQQPSTAIGLYRESLGILQSLGDRQGESLALQGLARAQRDLGYLTEARDSITKALTQLEQVRSNVVSQDMRASYLATQQVAYVLDIDVAMRLHRQDPSTGYAALALETSERARARSLLEMLTEAQTDIRRGVDPALVEKEKQLAQLINTKSERLIELPAGAAGQARAEAFSKEIGDLEAEYETVRADIRKTSPAFAAIVQPQPLSVPAIQKLLDDDTVLIEYSLGPERGYAWAVTPSSLRSYELASQAEIEKAARNAYALVTARSTSKPGESARQKQERIARADQQMLAAIRELSRLVIAPLEADLHHKRIVVVADGALQYVPFAMLTLSGATAEYRPLITDYEIVSAPSASAIAVQRQMLAGRKPAPKGIAIIADPVFSSNDARLRNVQAKTIDTTVAETAAATRILEHFAEGAAAGGRIIPRLPFTALEAKEIESVAGSLSHLTAVGFGASRAAIMSPDLANYRYVHFATHGYLDTERPDLSALVLSLVDEKGHPQEGFLRVHDIYNLNLPAELVVLSACETGLGKDIRGEGLVGLTRGFMYAGAARVAVSLWSVSDKATAGLMRDFYEGMLKRGERPAAALRAAQIEMLKQKEWSSPYYWASFVLQGEWR